MIKEILATSKTTGFRDVYEVLSKLMEEVGELAQEVGIKEGFQNRSEGPDGIVGEVADVVITAINLAWVADKTVTKKALKAKIIEKLAKWQKKSDAYVRTEKISMKCIDMNDMPDDIVPNHWFEKGEDVYFTHIHQPPSNTYYSKEDHDIYDYIKINFPDIKDGETIMIQGLY